MHTVLRYDERPHLLSSCLFATGRSCVLHLLNQYGPDAIFVPSLYPAGLMDPIRLYAERDNVEVWPYRIWKNFEVDLDSLAAGLSSVKPERPLIVGIHYFGYWLPMWGAAALAHKHGGILFEDCAHCLPTVRKPVCGDVRMYTYNKLFPVIDGALMMSCTPKVDVTRKGELERLQPEAVEAYSRHLSANRVIAAMPPGPPLLDDVLAVSKQAYDEYYEIISKDMEPRKPVSIEYFGEYDHEKERDERALNAGRLLVAVDHRHRFRGDLPQMAFPVVYDADRRAALLDAGLLTSQLGPRWSEGSIMLLPLHERLSDKKLSVVGEIFK